MWAQITSSKLRRSSAGRDGKIPYGVPRVLQSLESLCLTGVIVPPILLCACAGGSENSGKLPGIIPTPAGNWGILGRRSQCDWGHQFENSYRVYLLAN